MITSRAGAAEVPRVLRLEFHASAPSRLAAAPLGGRHSARNRRGTFRWRPFPAQLLGGSAVVIKAYKTSRSRPNSELTRSLDSGTPLSPTASIFGDCHSKVLENFVRSFILYGLGRGNRATGLRI